MELLANESSNTEDVWESHRFILTRSHVQGVDRMSQLRMVSLHILAWEDSGNNLGSNVSYKGYR